MKLLNRLINFYQSDTKPEHFGTTIYDLSHRSFCEQDCPLM